MITLACITDARFARHTGAMLQSALARTAPERCRVYVLHDTPLGDENSARLRAVVEASAGVLSFLIVPPAQAAQFPSGYFPRSIWYRVLLPELLPDSDRVLYLDSDMVVTDSLRPLWETDLGEHLLGAVTNPFYPFMPPHARTNLGIDEPRDYFNSGVLLMNLARMRAEGTTALCMAFARSHPGSSYPDQDALNVTCRDRWLHLHPRWNAQSTLYELAPRELPLPPAQMAEAIGAPAVIHFIGLFKPWHYLCRHPRQRDFLQAAAATPWGVPPIEGRNLRNWILRRLPLETIDRWLALERRAAAAWARASRRRQIAGTA